MPETPAGILLQPPLGIHMSFKIATRTRWICLTALALLLGSCDGKIDNQEVRKTLTTVVNLNSQNQLSDAYCQSPVVSDNGHIVAFFSVAQNLGPDLDPLALEQIYVRDTLQQTTILGSVNSNGDPADGWCAGAFLSGNGQYLVFKSLANNLADSGNGQVADDNDLGDLFIRDLVSGTTSRVSLTSIDGQLASGISEGCASWDGRWVAFTTIENEVIDGAGDTDSVMDVFVREIDTGDTIGASWHPVSGPSSSGTCRILPGSSAFSKDNRFIIFESTKGSDLHTDASDGRNHVFLRDLTSTQSDAIELISRKDNLPQDESDDDSQMGGISHDGRYITFTSSGIDDDGVVHVYVRDRIEETTTRVSVNSTGGEGFDYNGVSIDPYAPCIPSISGDGNIVVFAANDLSHLDQTTNDDIYSHNLTTGITLLVSVSTGSYLQAEEKCEGGVISGDGSTILFYSKSSNFNNLIPANNSQNNIFRRGRN